MEEKIKNFENEANILSKFNCKNIVKYYGSYKHNNKFYILMEYCEGQNLKDYINKNIYLIKEYILCYIIKQICIGIKEIHNKNIVHRDIKPENIFMNEDMDRKIGDFGIAKIFVSNKEYKLTLNKSGSLYYMAPEILMQGIYNKKSDLYSLGCILYELFNLSIYFNDREYDKIKRIDSNEYNSKWQEIIDSLLQADYNKRIDINKVYDTACVIDINELDNKTNKININNKVENKYSNNKNIIIGEIIINEDYIGKDIQIINSFEKSKLIYNWKFKRNDLKNMNEEEIKKNIKILINGKLIGFTYYYKFEAKGIYKIEYVFKNKLTKINCLFYGCELLTNLDLSNFNSQNVSNMSYMFCCCFSLKNLNLSNFNTGNVTNMKYMFYDCKSLINLNLSNFNTENVTNMSWMFHGCDSLANLNLSIFNTQNVIEMYNMFTKCKSLIKTCLFTRDVKILKTFNFESLL